MPLITGNMAETACFIQKTAVTGNGGIAEIDIYRLNQNPISEEEHFDGFYVVVTNLEGNVRKILQINRQRWEIEKNFRIMKSELDARPVYVKRGNRIKAHFPTCYISLLVYCLLKKKLGKQYSCEQILMTLRNMQMTHLAKNNGFMPSYMRTDITDAPHTIFGFHTDYGFYPKRLPAKHYKRNKAHKNQQTKFSKFRCKR